MPVLRDEIKTWLSAAVNLLCQQHAISAPAVQLERTRDAAHGDFASNIAMLLAKPLRTKPREAAATLLALLTPDPAIAIMDLAGPGFINFTLSAAAKTRVLAEIFQAREHYGKNNIGQGEKVQVEFVSANPTGPLHVGHGRGAVVGDCLCRLLSASGYQVTREFYYNDTGTQINNLALSVQARCRGIAPEDPRYPADGYRGSYIADVAQAYLARDSVCADDQDVHASGDANDVDAIRRFAVAYLRREQDLDLCAFAVRFDIYTLESSLYTDGKVDAAVAALQAQQHTFEDGGALWLRTTRFGDDKDRVMRKQDGSYTYFVSDIAYHLNKWQRGFRTVINEQGADHHSTITRVRAGLQALNAGIPAGYPEYVLHQMVTVMRGGEEMKVSKRAGSYVTLRDLIDEVGVDATRYFLVARKCDSHLVFDIDLARTQSSDNPVYYIQYAHARICSLFRQAREKEIVFNDQDPLAGVDLTLLSEPQEQALLTWLARFPESIEAAVLAREPHQLATYLIELANALHVYYNAHKFLTAPAAVRPARLALCAATRQVLANGLHLLGLSAPETM